MTPIDAMSVIEMLKALSGHGRYLTCNHFGLRRIRVRATGSNPRRQGGQEERERSTGGRDSVVLS